MTCRATAAVVGSSSRRSVTVGIDGDAVTVEIAWYSVAQLCVAGSAAKVHPADVAVGQLACSVSAPAKVRPPAALSTTDHCTAWTGR